MATIQTYGVIDATCPAANRAYDNAAAEIKQIDGDWEASDVKAECLKILASLHDFNRDLRDDLRKALEDVFSELQDLKKSAEELLGSAEEARGHLEDGRVKMNLDFDINKVRRAL